LLVKHDKKDCVVSVSERAEVSLWEDAAVGWCCVTETIAWVA